MSLSAILETYKEKPGESIISEKFKESPNIYNENVKVIT